MILYSSVKMKKLDAKMMSVEIIAISFVDHIVQLYK